MKNLVIIALAVLLALPALAEENKLNPSAMSVTPTGGAADTLANLLEVDGTTIVRGANGISSTFPAPVPHTVGITVDGGGSAITTGIKGYYRVPYTGTITGYSLQADLSGSAVVDIWNASGAIPTVADTITASAKPTLSAAQYVYSTTLTGWTKTVTAGDVIGFNIDSASTITRLTVQLYIQE
jgi:hypothetical protein